MNKQIRGGEEIFLPYSRIPINKVKKMMELGNMNTQTAVMNMLKDLRETQT